MATFTDGRPWHSEGWYGLEPDGWFSEGWWGDDEAVEPPAFGGGFMMPMRRRRRWRPRTIPKGLRMIVVSLAATLRPSRQREVTAHG